MMTVEALLRWLLDGAVATSFALLLVLALRRPLRHAFGARVAYAAWALVPLALLAASLPRPQDDSMLPQALLVLHPGGLIGVAAPLVEPVGSGAAIDWPLLLVLAWLAGMALLAVRFARQQRRFVAGLGALRRRDDGIWLADGGYGPAVVGAWRPRIVLPSDFDTRYPMPQAALVVAHERAHLHRGDARANFAAIVLRCLQWFNPLLHVAAARFRLDQELACDAIVLARHPDARRSYADAMLNTQLAVPGLPVGCHWQSSQSLKERILMLKHPQPGTRRRRLGALVLCVVLTGSSYAAWALRPAVEANANAALPAGGSGVGAMSAQVLQQASGVHMPAPPYPPEAVASGQGGRVVMKLLVATDGSVKDAVIENSTPTGVFDAVSVETARKWTFTPQLRDGRPVEGWIRVPIDFDPDGQTPSLPMERDGNRPPAYPSAALAERQGGRVVLKLLVAADGSVKDVVVEQSQPAGVFDAATVAAARQWTFNPSLKDGKPVAGWVRVPVDFAPEGRDEPAAPGNG